MNAVQSESVTLLEGATWILETYQQISWDKLAEQSISLTSPSILYAVRKAHPEICPTPEQDIISAERFSDYEPQHFTNLYHHLRHLQLEFVGHSELAFYHALLIVLLRRGFDVERTFAEFESLWQQRAEMLFEQLSLRWLISAADTLIDQSPDPVRGAILMNAVSLINSFKIGETQRILLTDQLEPRSDQVIALSKQHRHLYDGLTYFRLGSDDTLAQMRTRYQRFAQHDAFAARFLLVIFGRIHDCPGAFALIRQFHPPQWAYWVV